MKDSIKDYKPDFPYCCFLSALWRAVGCQNANRCPEFCESFIENIIKEAYPGGNLAPYSMFRTINETLLAEYAVIENVIREEIKAPNADQKKHQALLDFLHGVKHPELPSTSSQYTSPLSSLTNKHSGNWSKWLNARNKFLKFFDFIQIWLFEVLSPKGNETTEQKDARIGEIYRILIEEHLHQEIRDQELFSKHCRFTWQTTPTAPVILTEGTIGLISTVFVLYALHSDDFQKTAPTEQDSLFIHLFIEKILKKGMDKDLGYISKFNDIQQPNVFLARPHITKKANKLPPYKAFTPPDVIPWADTNFNTPARVMVQAPAGSGKSAMYQALGQALLGDRDHHLELASKLHIPRETPWVAIALNAQQYIYNWNQTEPTKQNSIYDMFFRGNLLINQATNEEQEHVMRDTVPLRVKNAHKNYRLILLLDGVDELTDKMLECLWRDIKNFLEDYPNAHAIMFTRPLSKASNIFQNFFPVSLTLESMNVNGSAYGRYQDLPGTPLMSKLLQENPDAPLPHILYDYTTQIISKTYDYDGRLVLLPKELREQNLQELAEHLAWNTALHNSSVLTELLSFMDLPEPELGSVADQHQNRLLSNEVAHKIGVLIPCGDKDYQFISPLVQGVLAVAHLTKLLQSNTSPVMIRTALQSLEDEQFRNIVFVLLHFLPHKAPLFAEVLLSDYMFREWKEDFADQALQDLQDLKQEKYGRTPFQQTTGKTLERMFSAAKPKMAKAKNPNQ